MFLFYFPFFLALFVLRVRDNKQIRYADFLNQRRTCGRRYTLWVHVPITIMSEDYCTFLSGFIVPYHLDSMTFDLLLTADRNMTT